MKKLVLAVVFVCAAPLVMAQDAADKKKEIKQLSPQALAKIAATVERATARERALQAQEEAQHGEKIMLRNPQASPDLEVFATAQKLIGQVGLKDTAAILAALNPLRNLYEQKRLENPALVENMAELLANVPFTTKDKKEVRVEAFIQMHINEVVADEKVNAEMVQRMGWDREGIVPAAEAQRFMNNMLDWKDHIREDQPR